LLNNLEGGYFVSKFLNEGQNIKLPNILSMLVCPLCFVRQPSGKYPDVLEERNGSSNAGAGAAGLSLLFHYKTQTHYQTRNR
jgi:hypothetical protein